jgi:Abortive infection alpha
MDPGQILLHGAELAKAGSAIGIAIPFTAVVKKILGPAADEIAERVRDEIRIYRYGRQLSLLKKAEQMAVEAGFTPKAVSTKLLFSLLEGASLEENEDLHDKWAALLANAANPDAEGSVRPSFTDTLKLMTPEVARFLDAVFSKASQQPAITATASELGIEYSGKGIYAVPPRSIRIRTVTLSDLGNYDSLFNLFGQTGATALPPDTSVTSSSSPAKIAEDELDRQNFALIMDELTRFQMWSIERGRTSGEHFYLSSYAVQFLIACHPPEPMDPS